MPNRTRTRRIPPALLQRARELRHPITPAEDRVWQSVRRHRLGVHIRRQPVLLGRVIPDFYCAAARLGIEFDGEAHTNSEQVAYNLGRTGWLEESGCRVIRFTSAEVADDLTAVLEGIRAACHEAATAAET